MLLECLGSRASGWVGVTLQVLALAAGLSLALSPPGDGLVVPVLPVTQVMLTSSDFAGRLWGHPFLLALLGSLASPPCILL